MVKSFGLQKGKEFLDR